jgi:tubulin alpha
LDETALDEIRTGTYRQILNCHISGKEDAAGNYARGYYTLGKEIVDQCMDRIRTLADDCDDLQGFFVLSSIGGGTGSGLGSLLLERLSADYAKKTKVSLSVFPSSELSTAVTEPYNSVLALHKLLEHTDVSVVFDNNALYSSCIRNIDIVKPTFANINRLIAQVASSLTTPLRFD